MLSLVLIYYNKSFNTLPGKNGNIKTGTPISFWKLSPTLLNNKEYERYVNEFTFSRLLSEGN